MYCVIKMYVKVCNGKICIRIILDIIKKRTTMISLKKYERSDIIFSFISIIEDTSKTNIKYTFYNNAELIE